MSFPPSSLVAIPSQEHGYIPAIVSDADGLVQGKPCNVRPLQRASYVSEQSEPVSIDAASTRNALRLCDLTSTDTNDLSRLLELNHASILLALKERFDAGLNIYTNVGPILISINPYKDLGLYTSEVQQIYLNKTSPENVGQGTTAIASHNSPHLYSIADKVFHGALYDHQDQSCIMSGESGAGKTESTKIFLKYIASASRSLKSGNSTSVTIEERIAHSNPLTEAFGNAKTIRNENSSRFGQWISIKVEPRSIRKTNTSENESANTDSAANSSNNNGSIVGCSITNYLLEKSRIVSQAEGERNYHIFYQLLASDACAEFFDGSSRDPSNYRYLSSSGLFTIQGKNDQEEFEITKNAMKTMGISDDDQHALFSALAGILHLGNVTFHSEEHPETHEPHAVLSNEDVLKKACSLLGLDCNELEHVLTNKNMSNSLENIWKPLTVEQSTSTRDALSKLIYGLIFDWVISRINEGMSSAASMQLANGESAVAPAKIRYPKKIVSIGVLDTFGFEVFDKNSFEQLCINYCNEKMQFYFNQRIFKTEQELYKSEGIEISEDVIKFVNNEPCLALIEKDLPSAPCLLTIIDDEIRIPGGSDVNYLRKIRQIHGNHSNFHPHVPERKFGPEASNIFGIKHYAGDVYYNIKGFLAKNQDVFPSEIETVCSKSSSGFVKSLFSLNSEKDFSSSSSAINRVGSQHLKPRKSVINTTGSFSQQVSSKKTLGTKFKEQLSDLMAIISETQTHFVRCIKPNTLLKPGVWNGSLVLKQLLYSGVLETCRIRRNGLPIRIAHSEFFSMFRALHPRAETASDLFVSVVEKRALSLIQDANQSSAAATASIDKKSIQLGKSLVFMSSEVYGAMESERAVAIAKLSTKISSAWRGKVIKAKAKTWREILDNIRSAIKDLDVPRIELLLESLPKSLPCNGGAHLSLVKEAQVVLVKLRQEQIILSQLDFAIVSQDIDSINLALDAASKIDHDLSGKVKAQIAKASRLAQKLKRGAELRLELRNAIVENDIKKLGKALKEAETFFQDDLSQDGIDLFDAEYDDANRVKKDLEQKQGAIRIQRATKRFLQRLKFLRALEQLRSAMEKKNKDAIEVAIKRLASLGIAHPLVLEAREMQKKIGEELLAIQSKLLDEVRFDRYKMLKTPNHVSNEDLNRLTTMIEEARKAGVNDDDLDTAMELKMEMEELVEVNKKMKRWRMFSCIPADGCMPTGFNLPQKSRKNIDKASTNVDIKSMLSMGGKSVDVSSVGGAAAGYSSMRKKKTAVVSSPVKSIDVKKSLDTSVMNQSSVLDTTADILSQSHIQNRKQSKGIFRFPSTSSNAWSNKMSQKLKGIRAAMKE